MQISEIGLSYQTMISHLCIKLCSKLYGWSAVITYTAYTITLISPLAHHLKYQMTMLLKHNNHTKTQKPLHNTTMRKDHIYNRYVEMFFLFTCINGIIVCTVMFQSTHSQCKLLFYLHV